MGHLVFAGLFCFFILVLFSRIYFGYLSAKRNKPNDPVEPIEISAEGMCFKPQKRKAIFYFSLIPVFLVVAAIGCFRLSKQNSFDANITFWLLVDSIVPVTLVFFLAAIKSFRSYLFINSNGFEYRENFRTKRFAGNEIQGIYRENEFIFIKCFNKRIPIILEKGYGDWDTIYRTLCILKMSNQKKSTEIAC